MVFRNNTLPSSPSPWNVPIAHPAPPVSCSPVTPPSSALDHAITSQVTEAACTAAPPLSINLFSNYTGRHVCLWP